MSIAVTAIGVTAAAAVGFLAARRVRITAHEARLRRPLRADGGVNSGAAGIGLALPVGVTAGDAIYEFSRIDSNVLDAIDQAHGGQAFETYNDLVGHIEDVASRGDAAVSGLVSQYKGYLGENLVAQHLRDGGHHVEMAATPNQEGWDAIVDGEKVQIKVGLDPDGVSDHLERYPDIPVVTVSEHAERFADEPMVMAIGELSGESIQEATESTIAGMDGLDDVGLDFPIVTAVLSGTRNLRLVAKGHSDLGTALEYTAADTIGVGVGGAAGAKAGVLLGGAILGPVGAAAGAIVGGIGGAIFGRVGSQKYKQKALREAQAHFDAVVTAYPDAYGHALRTKATSLAETADRVSPRGVRSVVWPSFGHIARRDVAGRYREDASECSVLADSVDQEMNAAETPDMEREAAKRWFFADEKPAFSKRLQSVSAKIQASYRRVVTEMGKLGMLKSSIADSQNT